LTRQNIDLVNLHENSDVKPKKYTAPKDSDDDDEEEEEEEVEQDEESG
jgi:hypothetical protein